MDIRYNPRKSGNRTELGAHFCLLFTPRNEKCRDALPAATSSAWLWIIKTPLEIPSLSHPAFEACRREYG